MRDPRFIAIHRGGSLDIEHHRLLAFWAADCAEHVLPWFVGVSSDPRPLEAIQLGRAWARNEIPVGRAQKASVAAHAAARETRDPFAAAAARAAGHAVATAHFADHCMGPVIYGLKAVATSASSMQEEYHWQLSHLPDPLHNLITSALDLRLPKYIKNIIKL